MSIKKISILGTVGVPASYGGFETLVDNLIDPVDYEDCQESNLFVYCSSKHYQKSEQKKYYKNAELIYVPLKANGVQSILYDMFCMLHAVISRSNVLLILGVSGCLFLPFIRFFSDAKIVTNIDGIEWRRDKWGKIARFILRLSERSAVLFSDVVIADNQAIADYVMAEYHKPCSVIAYGGDHAINSTLKKSDELYALSVCRIEPENNIELILNAFSNSKINLKIIGNWNNSAYGIRLKEKYSEFDNIEMIEPIYDLEILQKFRSACSFYVHGHSAGGTNPSLVEMMHFGKPIYCFDCNYNRATTEDKSIYFKDATQLNDLLLEPISLDVGVQMMEIANRRYTWSTIRKQYFDVLISD